MTDTMQALYRYTAEGRFSSYLTGADYREVCRVLDKLEQTLRQLLPAGERDLLSRLETARLEQRDLELEAMFQAAWTAAQEVPCNLRPRACPRRTAKRPRPSFGPPPQRPFRRQCRSAASRTAGTSKRRQQPTGDSSSPVLRPRESPGRDRSPFPVSAAKRRKEQGSFSPAACTSGKILFTERSVGGPSRMGLRRPSEVPSPSAKRPAGVRPGLSKSPLRKAPPF